MADMLNVEETCLEPKKKSFEDIVGIVLMIGICVVMALGVFFRYVLNNSLSWTEELSRYGFIYITFIGTSVAIRHDSHIRIDLLDRLLGIKSKTVMSIVNHVITLAFLVFLVLVSFQIITALYRTKSTALRIPMSYLYLSGFIGFSLSSVRLAGILLRRLRRCSIRKTERIK